MKLFFSATKKVKTLTPILGWQGPENESGPTRNWYPDGTWITGDLTMQAACHAASKAYKKYDLYSVKAIKQNKDRENNKT